MNLGTAARILDYQDALQRTDLTDVQREALKREIARLSEVAPEPPFQGAVQLPPRPPMATPAEMAFDIRAVARRKAEEELAKRTGQGQFTAEAFEEEVRRQTQMIEQQRRQIVRPGGEPTPGVDAGFFRPTRIVTGQAPVDLATASRILDLEEALEREDLTPESRSAVESQLEQLRPGVTRRYRDPETGLLSEEEPSALEELREAFSAQVLMGEEEARRQAGRGEAPLGILARQEEGVGVVETPLAQTLRGTLGLAEAILGEAYVRGLGFEVDEEGNPLDPEDWAYQSRQILRDIEEASGGAFRVPEALSVTEAALTVPLAMLRLGDAAARGVGIGDSDRELLADRVSDYLRTSPAGIATLPGIFAPSTSTTQKSTILDPEGRMVVDDIEVPSFFEDPAGFFEAETRRLARNVASGRGVLDEVRDSPASADFAREAFGHEDWAYAFGLPLLFATPATPIGLAKGAVAGTKVGARAAAAAPVAVARATTALGRGAQSQVLNAGVRFAPPFTRTVSDIITSSTPQAFTRLNDTVIRYTDPDFWNRIPTRLDNLYQDAALRSYDRLVRANSFIINTPLYNLRSQKVREALLALDGAAIGLANATGRGVGTAMALLKPGRASDVLVNRRVTEAALRTLGISRSTVDDIMGMLDFKKLRTVDFPSLDAQAFARIARAVEQTGKLGAEENARLRRLLQLNLPEDYVMVTDSFAAPRAHAAQARAYAQSRVRAGANSSGRSAADVLERLKGTLDPGADTRAIDGIIRRLREGDEVGALRERVIARDIIKPKQLERALVQAGVSRLTVKDSVEQVLSAQGDDLLTFFGNNLPPFRPDFTGKVGLLDVVDGRVLPLSLQSDKTAIIEALVRDGLLDGVNSSVRRARDIGHGQMYLDTRRMKFRDIVSRAWDTPYSRQLRILVADPVISDLTKQGVDFANAIRRRGRLAGRMASQALEAEAFKVLDAAVVKVLGEPLAANRLARMTQYNRVIARGLDETGVMKDALNNMLRKGMEEVGVTPEQAWDKFFEVAYGGDVNKESIRAILEGRIDRGGEGFATFTIDELEDASLMGISRNYPSIDSMMAVDAVVSKSAIENMASPGRFNTPDFQGIAMGMYLDEVLKKLIAGEVLAEGLKKEGLNLALWQQVSPGTLNLRTAILDPAMRQKVEEAAESLKRTVGIPGVHGFNTPTFGLNMDIERKLAESPWEFIEYIGKTTPRGRATAWELAQQGAGFLQNARLNILQAFKYGYFTPNLRHAVWRGMSTPFVMASQIGARKALQVAPRAALGAVRGLAVETSRALEQAKIPGMSTVQTALRQLLQRVGGIRGGITNPNGVYYPGEELVRLAETRGVGFTAVTAERVYSLTQDIFESVRRSLPPKAQANVSWKNVSPLQKTFWIRTAEAMERSARQGAFEARIAAGDTVEQAAEVARKVFLDYDDIPRGLSGLLSKLFQGGSTTYQLTTALVKGSMENPKMFSGYLRGLEENKRRQDPYNIGGDATLLNLVVNTEDGDYLLRMPGAGVLDTVLNIMIYADVGYKNMAEVARLMDTPEARASDIGAKVVTTVFHDGLGPVVYSGGSAFLGGVLRNITQFESVRPYEREETVQSMSDEKLLWAILVQAHHLDPDGEAGIWKSVMDNLDPVDVPPPEGMGHPTYRKFWKEVPENKPHIYWGQAPDSSDPLYMVFEPSERGINVMSFLRALPDNFLEAYSGGVGLFYAPEVMREKGVRFGPSQGNPRVYYARGAVPDDLTSIAMSLIANPTYIDYRNKEEAEAERARIAQEALTIRETIE